MTGWSPEMKALIAWFKTWRVPSEEFPLRPGVIVVEPGRFRASLEADLRSGPNGPRAQGGMLVHPDVNEETVSPLQADLAALKARFGETR